jgi:hypothetical protein
MPKKSNKRKKPQFKKIKEKIKLIFTYRKNKLYMKTGENKRAEQIKPKTKKGKQEVRDTIKGMKQMNIKKIKIDSSVEVDVKKPLKKRRGSK